MPDQVIDAQVVDESKSPVASLAPVAPDAGPLALPKGCEWGQQVNSLDWDKLDPRLMAMVLMQKRFPAGQGGYFQLTFAEALIVAMFCREKGVSPLSNDIWIDSVKRTPSLTAEGQKTHARTKGFRFGATSFTRQTREWPKKLPRLPFVEEDIGYTATMKVDPGAASETTQTYTAWLSEWGVRVKRDAKDKTRILAVEWMSPQWEERTEHMLQIRAAEKNMEFADGTGMSADPTQRPTEEA